MFPKHERKFVSLPNGNLRSDYRTYESYVLNYLDEKNLLNFKSSARKLFKVIPDNTLSALYRKIKKNLHIPAASEEILLEYFEKYNIDFNSLPKTRKTTRKKEDKSLVNARVRKFREKTEKVSFQCLISPDLKKRLIKLKKDKNLTYEKLLIDLLS